MTAPHEMLESARIRLDAARLLLNEGFYGDSLSRCYFAVLAAARTLLTRHGLDAATHHGVQMLLYRHFSGVIDTRLFARLWQEREAYDYRALTPDRAHAASRLEEAERFVARIAELLEETE